YQTFRERPLDRTRERVTHRRVCEAELAGGARAVVAVAVQHRTHHRATDGRMLAPDAKRTLDAGGGDLRDRGRQEGRLLDDAGHPRHDLERLARLERRPAQYVTPHQ